MVRRVRKKNGYIYGVVSSDLGEVGFVLDGGLLSFCFFLFGAQMMQRIRKSENICGIGVIIVERWGQNFCDRFFCRCAMDVASAKLQEGKSEKEQK